MNTIALLVIVVVVIVGAGAYIAITSPELGLNLPQPGGAQIEPEVPYIPDEIAYFRGIIQTVQVGSLVVKPQSLENEAIRYELFMPETVSVSLTPETVLMTSQRLTDVQYEKALQAYERACAGKTECATPAAQLYVDVPLDILGFSEGDSVVIQATGNVKNASEVTAIEVRK